MPRKDSGNGHEGQSELRRAIWNEMKAVKQSLEREPAQTREHLGKRIDETNFRLEAVRLELKGEDEALHRRLVESEMRVASAVTELAGETRDLSRAVTRLRDEHRQDRSSCAIA